MISSFWIKANGENAYSTNWELFKFEIGKFIRKFGSLMAKSKKAEEMRITTIITELSQKHPNVILEYEKVEMTVLMNDLDELYKRKAKGAFIRSRRKWIEEGEQNSHYFFNLERRNFMSNTINKLNINGVATDDYIEISKYYSDFYKKLYTSNYSQITADAFLNSLRIRSIDEKEKEFCDKPIVLSELTDAVNQLKNSKSPGSDGLTSEFYKQFSEDLATFLLEVFVESFEKQCLPPTLTQGVITLIPKPKKDKYLIDNWSPICLLNNDYKLLALILAKRLKSVLNSIIDESQSGFMKNRHISNNIRLVLDILDYSELVNDGAFILFVDFCKAFDSVEHNFIYDTLKKSDFGNFFSNAIKTLYKNGNCSIKLSMVLPPDFQSLEELGRMSRVTISFSFSKSAPILSYYFKSNERH